MDYQSEEARDLFAAFALSGLLSNNARENSTSEIITLAWRFSDYMMIERMKRLPKTEPKDSIGE